MEQDRSDHSTIAPAAPRQRVRSPEVFLRAVEILKAKHHVSDSLAYAMLVHDGGCAGKTVREIATALIAESSTPAKPGRKRANHPGIGSGPVQIGASPHLDLVPGGRA